MTNVMHAQQSKSISDFGPSSFGSRIVLIPPTTENAAGCKTALLIKNEVFFNKFRGVSVLKSENIFLKNV